MWELVMNLWNSNASAEIWRKARWDKASKDGDDGDDDDDGVPWYCLALRGANGPSEGRMHRILMLDGSCFVLKARGWRASHSNESARFSQMSCLQRGCGGKSSWWVVVMN